MVGLFVAQNVVGVFAKLAVNYLDQNHHNKISSTIKQLLPFVDKGVEFFNKVDSNKIQLSIDKTLVRELSDIKELLKEKQH